MLRSLIEADVIIPSTRATGLLLLLFGTPIPRIVALTRSDFPTTPSGISVRLGILPAPIPEPLTPLFRAVLDGNDNQRTSNTGTSWVFPRYRAGQHISAQTLMLRLRGLGIDLRGSRNAALADLSKELDGHSLSDLLGYSPTIIARHAERAAVAFASYPTARLRDTSPGRTPNSG